MYAAHQIFPRKFDTPNANHSVRDINPEIHDGEGFLLETTVDEGSSSPSVQQSVNGSADKAQETYSLAIANQFRVDKRAMSPQCTCH